MNEKRPRHYIAEIIAANSRDERQRLLQQVPSHYRHWVETEVRYYFQRKQINRETA